MAHHFSNTHNQHLKVDPLEHELKVATKLAEPIHHALQMRTPLELRFCNPWHITSNYVFDFTMGKSQVLSLSLIHISAPAGIRPHSVRCSHSNRVSGFASRPGRSHTPGPDGTWRRYWLQVQVETACQHRGRLESPAIPG